MADIDLAKIESWKDCFGEVHEIVAEIELTIHHPLEEDDPLKFKVKVLRDKYNQFTGIPSHRKGDYVSLKPKDSVESAIMDALSAIMAWYNPEIPMRDQFSPYEDY